MASISYSIGIGGTLETVTAGTNAPASGQIELRFDQTAFISFSSSRQVLRCMCV